MSSVIVVQLSGQTWTSVDKLSYGNIFGLGVKLNKWLILLFFLESLTPIYFYSSFTDFGGIERLLLNVFVPLNLSEPDSSRPHGGEASSHLFRGRPFAGEEQKASVPGDPNPRARPHFWSLQLLQHPQQNRAGLGGWDFHTDKRKTDQTETFTDLVHPLNDSVVTLIFVS